MMQPGRVVETTPTEALLAHSHHPYPRRLLAEIPTGAGTLQDLHAIPGTLPDLRRTDLPLRRVVRAQSTEMRPALGVGLAFAGS